MVGAEHDSVVAVRPRFRRRSGESHTTMDKNPFLEPYRDIASLRARAFQVLGLRPDASLDEIQAAFRKLARERHPDVGGEARDFTNIVNAYLILTKPDPRGFLIQGEDDAGLEVPQSASDYLRWWLDRFAP